MSKGKKQVKEGGYRQIIDAGVHGTWIRERRYGQIGYREPQPPPEPEQYIPLDHGPKRPLAWRLDEHGPLPSGRKKSTSIHTSYIANPKYGRKAKRQRAVSVAPERHLERAVTPRPAAAIQPSDAITPTELLVPTPAERVRTDGIVYAARDGQSEFRSRVLAAYGCCALTGCTVEAVLQAAHIIPYVDARSNIVTNGLCLRADIHLLYDRNLITIGGNGIVAVDSLVECAEYRSLHGLAIRKPSVQEDWPDGHLLSVRHQYIATK